jgi:hypothetical protein
MVIMVGLGVVAVFRILSDEANRIVIDEDEANIKAGCGRIIWKVIKEDSEKASLVDNKAKVLTDHDVKPVNITEFGRIPTRWLMTNAQALLRFTVIMQVIAVALWVSASFIVLGIVVINSKAYDNLLPANTQPMVITSFSFLGQTFIISQQLVLLSVTLGTIAGLTFATQGLQDDSSRQRFITYSLADLKCSLATLSYYLGAFGELIRLLGLNRDKILAFLRGDIPVNEIAPRKIEPRALADGDNDSQQSSE